MTERKSSYLTGLGLANQYAVQNAFKGNTAADFGAMFLFRNKAPFDGFGISAVQQFLCGNLQALATNNTKGWGLRWLAGVQPGAQLELLYGDSALAQQSFVARPLTPTQMAQRTMLVHVFLLRDPIVAGPNNVAMLLYVNGGLVARSLGLSFTPADGTGTFRIGGASVNGSGVDAPDIGAAGFGYCGSIPGATLAAKLATVQAMVDATVSETLDTGDVADDALLTSLFSVRRTLSDPRPTWTPIKGAVGLTRVGSSSLSVEAAAPLFGDVPWEDLTPVPDPLQIMGKADLIGWWRGDAIISSGGLVSEAIDLTGNGRHLVQGTGALQPGILATGGPNNTPAFVFDGTGILTGTAKRLSRSGATGLNIGDFPSPFVVQQMDTTEAANLCNTFNVGDSVTATHNLFIDRRNTVPPGHFGALANAVGTVGGFDGPAALDQLPHLVAILLQALAANVYVDGALGADKTSTGGLILAPDTIDMGGSSFLTGNTAFGGLIMDSWITRVQPSPAQLAALNTYVRNRYGIPIP